MIVLGALLLDGCGYRLAGGGDEWGRPPTTVWLAPVVDEGDEPLFGALLARALSRETANRADTALRDREGAEVVLRVRLESVREVGIAYSADDSPTEEYLITARAAVTVAGRDGGLLWKGVGLSADRAFAAGSNVEETEYRKRQAMELLARDLAREVLRRAALKSGGRP